MAKKTAKKVAPKSGRPKKDVGYAFGEYDKAGKEHVIYSSETYSTPNDAVIAAQEYYSTPDTIEGVVIYSVTPVLTISKSKITLTPFKK